MPPRDPPPGAHITYSRQFRRCRRPTCPSCAPGAPGHGPYWYAYWREQGRVRSRYLGKLPPTGATDGAAAPDTAAQARAALRVRTLGGFEVWRGGSAVPATSWRRRKVAALFKYLLSVPEQRAHRDYLQETLWPDEEPDMAAANLRLTLHRLRRVLGASGAAQSYVRLDGEMIVLDPCTEADQAGWLDAAVFERVAIEALAGCDAGACRGALALYTGDYLPDDIYDEWTIARREALRGKYLALLLHLADLRAAAGDSDEAARHLRDLLVVEPSHEAAARALMAAQAAGGHPAEAVRTYHALTDALQRDVGVEPAAQTRALYETLLAAQASAAARRTNLPAPLTSFLGRDQELAALAALLGSPAPTAAAENETAPCRLLTLTGAGGCGKTRLAIELGRELLDGCHDGVWLVELAALSDTALIVPEVARALGLLAHAPDASLDMLTAHLGARQLLLILDNCEHLLDGCARIAAALLSACPSLRILATSREALGIVGESVWRVPSLAVPDPVRLPPPDELRAYAAIRLFVGRARAVQPAFALTASNSRAVAEICYQLDGIPLAIELAAARLLALTVAEVSDRLSDRFQLLAGGNRAALPRHRTLRAVLDWSYALLAPPERVLLRRLAVFVGGWSREAAEAVCGGGEVTTGGVAELLDRLAAKSLVQRHDGDAGGTEQPRYQLLQTVRQYALSQATEDEEWRGLRDAHLSWYLSLAERADLAWHGPEQQRFLGLLDVEHDNMRAALSWCAADGSNAAAGLRLASALASYWDWRGYLAEGRTWLRLFLTDHASTDVEDAASARRRCTALCRAGSLAYRQGDAAAATALLEEGLALARQLEDAGLAADCLNNLGVIAKERGEYARAAALFEETMARDSERGDERGVIIALANLAWVAHARGDYTAAATLAGDCLARSRALGDSYYTAHALGHRAHAAYALGEIAQAAALYRETLVMARDLGVRWGFPICLEGLARVVTHQGRPDQAARWWGAAAALREEIGVPLPPDDRAVYGYDRAIAEARALLGEARFAEEWRAGQVMSLERAIAEALDEGQPS